MGYRSRRGRSRYYDRGGYGSRWAPYVPVAERRRAAAGESARLAGSGRAPVPVVIEGRAIATTFWGKAWCDHIESYHDFENRLPRGRTYVRNGSVIDLRIQPGEVRAMVSGSTIYDIVVRIPHVAPERWNKIVQACAGRIDSVVELLAGKLASGVMERLCGAETGLFPGPRELKMQCSCPDYATMCKHVAAVLYGVGARLDENPELLFVLRGVSHGDLIAKAATAGLGKGARPAAVKSLEGDDLSALFGIDIERGAPARPAPRPSRNPVPAVAAAPAKPSPTTRAAKREKASPLITTQELLERGIPRTTFQNWVQDGSLERTDRRGVYRLTARAEERIRLFLKRAVRGR